MRRIMNRKWMILMGWALVATAGTGFAADWEAADQLYNQRGDGRDAVASARAAYLTILDGAQTSEDKIRAVSQLGRLALYEGEMLLSRDESEARKEIFGDCWCKQPTALGTCAEPGFIAEIDPSSTSVDDSPNFYYFKGLCLAFWAQANSPIASLPFLSTLRSTIDAGMERDRRFEGGGIERLTAGIYSSPSADAVGLFRPEEALEYINNALTRDAYPGDPLSGAEYYGNWRQKALTLIALERFDDAEVILVDAIEEIEELLEEDELPDSQKPEAIWNLGQMQDILEELED